MQADVDNFLATTPTPTSADIANFLKLYGNGDRVTVAQSLITSGVDAGTVSAAMCWLETSGAATRSMVWKGLSVLSAVASGYHGTRRNNGSIGAGIWWFLMGGLFSVMAPVFAIAQGFAKPKAS